MTGEGNTDSTLGTAEFNLIPNHPGYRAGVDGAIWSCWNTKGSGYARPCRQVMTDRWHKLKPLPRKEDGRARYTVKRADGSYRRCFGSALILEAFVGPCPPGLEACHNNGNCLDDRPDNLRWDTHSANMLDRRRHGTAVCGEDINTAKLTIDDVREIRRIGYPLKPLAIRFGISETMVSLIIRRKAWQHVE